MYCIIVIIIIAIIIIIVVVVGWPLVVFTQLLKPCICVGPQGMPPPPLATNSQCSRGPQSEPQNPKGRCDWMAASASQRPNHNFHISHRSGPIILLTKMDRQILISEYCRAYADLWPTGRRTRKQLSEQENARTDGACHLARWEISSSLIAINIYTLFTEMNTLSNPFAGATCARDWRLAHTWISFVFTSWLPGPETEEAFLRSVLWTAWFSPEVLFLNADTKQRAPTNQGHRQPLANSAVDPSSWCRLSAYCNVWNLSLSDTDAQTLTMQNKRGFR